MKKISKNNIIRMIITGLILLLFGTGYYAYSLNQKYINSKYNEYNEAFGEAVNCINNVENFLAKATILKKSNVFASCEASFRTPHSEFCIFSNSTIHRLTIHLSFYYTLTKAVIL